MPNSLLMGTERSSTDKAASELAKDFDAVYKPNCSTSDLPECGSHVTAEDRYEIPGVVAKWMKKGHNSRY